MPPRQCAIAHKSHLAQWHLLCCSVCPLPSPFCCTAATGAGSATAQLEAMLARLPAERVAAHDAAIQQLRPLLKRVRHVAQRQTIASVRASSVCATVPSSVDMVCCVDIR